MGERIIVNLSYYSLSEDDKINEETRKIVSKELYDHFPQSNISVNIVKWSSSSIYKVYVDDGYVIKTDEDVSNDVKDIVEKILATGIIHQVKIT